MEITQARLVQETNALLLSYREAMKRYTKAPRRRAMADRAWLVIERLIGLSLGLSVGWILWA